MLENKTVISTDTNNNVYLIDPNYLEEKYWEQHIDSITTNLYQIYTLSFIDLIITIVNLNKKNNKNIN